MTDPSTVAAGDEPVVETTTQDVNPAESSAADQGVKSTLDAVNSALGEHEASPGPDEQAPKEPDPKTPPAEKPDLSEEDLKLSKGAQRRIRDLVEERKTVEAQVAPLRQELDAIKPKAEQFEQISGFMREHNISQDHLSNALGLTAMLNKGEFERALPILETLYNQVREQAGEVLPADLQQRVALGYITEADAKKLHKAEKTATSVQQKAERERQTVEERDRQTAHDTMVTGATTAADKWSKEQATSDPDWNQKHKLVTEKMELILHRNGPKGFPRTEQDVRKLLDQAKKDVEAEVGVFRPKPKPIDFVAGGSVSPRSVAKPKSVLEALEAGLAKSNGG